MSSVYLLEAKHNHIIHLSTKTSRLLSSQQIALKNMHVCKGWSSVGIFRWCFGFDMSGILDPGAISLTFSYIIDVSV